MGNKISIPFIFSAAIVSGAGYFISTLPVYAAGFVEDSTLTGAFYYWQRQRDRKELTPTAEHYGQYRANLHHSTLNTSLDYQSGYAADFIGLDLAVFGAVELANSGPAAPNEIGFSDARTRWDEEWSGDKSGASIYKAAVKLKWSDYWLRAGYLQPSGQTLLAPHWSFLPGTYRGFESGAKYDFSTAGELSFSYMWSDYYKAPGINTCITSAKPMARQASLIYTPSALNMTSKTIWCWKVHSARLLTIWINILPNSPGLSL